MKEKKGRRFCCTGKMKHEELISAKYFFQFLQSLTNCKTGQKLLRLRARHDQGGVIQATTPTSMKLGQYEGYTKQTLKTEEIG